MSYVFAFGVNAPVGAHKGSVREAELAERVFEKGPDVRIACRVQDFRRTSWGGLQQAEANAFVEQVAQLDVQPEGLKVDSHWDRGLGGGDLAFEKFGSGGSGGGGAGEDGHRRNDAGVGGQPAEEVLFIFPARE